MQYHPETRERLLDRLKRDGLAPTHYRMAEMTGRNKRVLEIGCATGYVSQLMKSNGCEISAIELDPIAAESARQFCDHLIVGDANLESTLFSAGSGFDVILCGDVLEHLIDPKTTLIKLADKLNPTGYILASIPNVAYWTMRLHLLSGRFEYSDSGLLDWTHLRFFTVHSFRKLCHECGYRIEEIVPNDMSFPFSRLLAKLPLMKTVIPKIELWLSKTYPNMFMLHAIYKLRLNKSGTKKESSDGPAPQIV